MRGREREREKKKAILRGLKLERGKDEKLHNQGRIWWGETKKNDRVGNQMKREWKTERKTEDEEEARGEKGAKHKRKMITTSHTSNKVTNRILNKSKESPTIGLEEERERKMS